MLRFCGKPSWVGGAVGAWALCLAATAATQQPPAASATTGASAGTVVVEESTGATTTADEEVDSTSVAARFGGSTVSVTNSTATQGLRRDADLTWNPYVATTFGIAPRYAFFPKLVVGANASVTREWTESDYTTRSGEWEFSDVQLRVSSPAWYTIPVLEIAIGSDLLVQLPASKASRARTMRFAAGPGLTLSRRFDVLRGLTIAYSGRLTGYNHRFTTGEFEEPTIANCGADCAELQNTGVRNPVLRIANGGSISLGLPGDVSLSASATFILDPLHDQPDGADLLFSPTAPADTRFANSYSFGVGWQATQELGLSLSADTVNPQRGDSGQGYYTPFVNRFTMLSLNVALDLGAAFARMEGTR